MSKHEKDSTNAPLKGKTFQLKTLEKEKIKHAANRRKNNKDQSINNEMKNREINYIKSMYFENNGNIILTDI